MKKWLAFLCCAALLAGVLLLPAGAAAQNTKVEIAYAAAAPKIDGTVKAGEYGAAKPFHSFSKSSGEFVTDFDQYGDWGFDFHICWDEKNLYMAWVVKTDIQVAVSKEQDYNNDGKLDEVDLSYMFNYCCIQFLITPGAPDKGRKTYQTSEWTGNYIDAGLALLADGESFKYAWSRPVSAPGLKTNDWDFVGTRDEAKGVTTYEVRIPWDKSGVERVGNGAQFGLTYAVAAQEDFAKKQGMISWQEAYLGKRNADAAAIVTMTGSKHDAPDVSSEAPERSAGTLPESYVKGVSKELTIDGVNQAVTENASVVVTDLTKLSVYNLKYTQNLLLEPVAGKSGFYRVAATATGTGADPAFADAPEGAIVAAFHGDAGQPGEARKKAAASLSKGDYLYLFGVDLAGKALQYSNAMLYTVDAAAAGAETSGAVSDTLQEESSQPKESGGDSSALGLESAGETSDAEDGGLSAGAVVGIVLAVVAVAGAAVAVVLLRRRRNASE